MENYFAFMRGTTEMNRLRRFNLIMGILHLVQAIAMVILAGTVIQKIAEFQPDIVQFYITYDPLQQILVVQSKLLFALPFGVLVSVFLFISSGAHALISLPNATYRIYESDLGKGINRFRWFVWAIVGTYFVAFNTFPVNMILQYLKVGKWANYLYGERVYIILSLVAKSILAWLVLFGAMQPA